MLSITFPENVGQSYFDWPIFGLVAMRTYFGLVVVNDPSSKNADLKIVHSIFSRGDGSEEFLLKILQNGRFSGQLLCEITKNRKK